MKIFFFMTRRPDYWSKTVLDRFDHLEHKLYKRTVTNL